MLLMAIIKKLSTCFRCVHVSINCSPVLLFVVPTIELYKNSILLSNKRVNNHVFTFILLFRIYCCAFFF